MKNKKGMSPFGLIGTAIILMLIVWILVGVIKNYIVDQEIAYAGGQVEEYTVDCDGDNVKGFLDQCPCNRDPDKTELDEGEDCGPNDNAAKDICPKLCGR